MLESIRRLAATFVGILQTRLELASVEVEEQVAALVRLLLLAVSALLLLAVGLLLATLFVLIAFWDTHRLVAAGALTLVYLGGGVILALMAQRAARARPRLFAASLAELGKDRDQLKGRHEPTAP